MAYLRQLWRHAQRGFPRPLRHATTALGRLRSVTFRVEYGHWNTSARTAVTLFRTLAYPFAAMPGIIEAVRHLPRYGVPASAQDLLPMYRAALLENIPPVEYLLFGFQDHDRRRRSGDYLYWMDQPALQWLNRQRGANNDDVQDKARFATLCQQAGLPHVATLAEFRGGLQAVGEDAAALTGSVFWQKPTRGSGGHGARRWCRTGTGTFRSGAEELSPSAWAQHLSKVDCIVQYAVQNHADLRGLSNGAAIVLRLVTVLERSGTCTLIGSSVALPQGAAESTRGALSCVPDLSTGSLRKVSLAGADEFTTHPDTGAVLVGSVLPCWTQCCALVQRAHKEAFGSFASLGWDVVVTGDGPVLLEANSGWGTLGQQMDFGPLGDTPLARVAADELERARCA